MNFPTSQPKPQDFPPKIHAHIDALTFLLSFQKWFYAKDFLFEHNHGFAAGGSAGLHKTAILNRDENINDHSSLREIQQK